MTPAVAVPRLARGQRALLLASIAGVTAAAWLCLLHESGAPLPAMLLPRSHAGMGMASFGTAVAMWLAMSVAMMAPATLNGIFAYAALAARSGRRGLAPDVAAFVAGYFSVWFTYGTAAAALQIRLQDAGWLEHGHLTSTLAGLLLAAAGALHFTPLSRACLKHCRNPLTYFLTRWENGPRGGFRFGIAHGRFCLGCCWALMLTGFAIGVMNPVWMALLTVLVCAEKLMPSGERIARAASVALILWGSALALGNTRFGF
ncbi:MAG: DUF2182 domain-containing protein [Acidobacteriota bacterium]|nr:DUF2182 domain-containing protein [Acidobacteriota bacterium]